MGQLTDPQALVLALFNYGQARDANEIAAHLRVDVGEAMQLCSGLAQRGLIQLEPARLAP